MHQVNPTDSRFLYSGRWLHSTSGTVIASWCSASLEFLCSSSVVRIRAGGRTVRKDRWNGGIPMLAWSAYHVDAEGRKGGPAIAVGAADALPFQEIVIVDEGDASGSNSLYRVEITLIDWASIFEIEAVIVDSENSVRAARPLLSSPTIDVLLIGDSISCGYVGDQSTGSDPVLHSRGYLQAYPSVAQRILNATRTTLPTYSITCVSYPGITLADPVDGDSTCTTSRGMAERFFHVSPWESSLWSFSERPSVVIISLGTNDIAQDIAVEDFGVALRAFLKRLIDLFFSSLQNICVITPFPDFLEEEEQRQQEQQLKEGVTTDDNSLMGGILVLMEQICTALQEEHNIPIHVFDIAEGMSRVLTIDGLHPTSQGHELLGQNLAEKLQGILGY